MNADSLMPLDCTLAAHNGMLAHSSTVLPETCRFVTVHLGLGLQDPNRQAHLIMASPPRQLTRLTMRKSSPYVMPVRPIMR